MPLFVPTILAIETGYIEASIHAYNIGYMNASVRAYKTGYRDTSLHVTIHSVNTRNKNQLHRPTGNLSCFQKRAYYAGIRFSTVYQLVSKAS
jgi:hypothetical protein